ncbi:MAG: EAL domain-containing protein [Sulfuritalea sp.]|nr:EAL domain-containing protein [Sulfuritalea sp.]
MSLAPRPLRGSRFLGEWLFLLAALTAFGGYIGYSQYQDYLQIEIQERERLTTEAAVIEKNLVPQLHSANHALETIRDDLSHWRMEKDGQWRTNRRLQVFADILPGMRVLLVVDADGRITASNNATLVGASLAHREWFQLAARNNAPQTLYLIPPIKSLIDTYVMALARSVARPNGEFGGVVYASFDPDFARTQLDSVLYTPDAWAALAHGDGKLFMMAPEKKHLAGTDLATPGSLFTRHRDSGQKTNVYTDRVAATGEQRMIAQRTIHPDDLFMDKPLVVAVSRDPRTIFASWQRATTLHALLFGIVAVVAVLSLGFYQRRQRGLQDIADRHEQALQASADRLNEAQRIAQVGNWTLDLVSGELTWSDQVFRLFEIDPARFGATYDAFLNAIHPDDREAVHQAYAESLVTRQPYEVTHRLRMNDGRIKWVHEKCLSEFDATGKPLRSLGTVQDITDGKLAEIELRIAAAAFDSQEAMMVTDANSVILRVNRAFVEITGYTPEEVVGQTPRLLQSGRHDRTFYREMWETITRTGAWQGEVWDRRKDGTVYPKWLTISAVKDDSGAVTHYIGSHYDITERKIAEEKIRQLAFFDQLTGLPNRTLLMDRLRQTMAASSRSGGHAALLFIDLDNFKTLNDTLGHDKGDLLLKQVAQRLKLCVREGDTVAHLSGDEFVVVLAGLDADSADAAADIEAIVEKILASLNQDYLLADVVHHSTASIGITLFMGDPTSIDELMKQADLAMYKSKEAGRNTWHFFDPGMESAVKERAALEDDLRLALQEQQFVLHFQAQVVGERLTGAEVLVRWQHPQRGMVPPGEFIPLAEDTGLILPLGEWVLDAACRQLARWATQPELAHLTLAVNVSAHQFGQVDFVDQVLAVLKNTGANPRFLKLELTESLLVDNVQDIIGKMFALKARGVGFALDDFGTGYSSLSYLKRLPLDQLKIDQSFVRDILVDPNDAAIARTIVALAESLGLGVIAEGVETETQREFLAKSGCHAFQGYLYSKPVPLDKFEELMTAEAVA